MGKTQKQMAAEVEGILNKLFSLLASVEPQVIDQYDTAFFTIFREAYTMGYCCPLRYRDYLDSGRREWIKPKNKPQLNSESLRCYAYEREWVKRGEQSRRRENLDRLCDWWDAWTLALEQIGYKCRCHRTIEEDPYRSLVKP